MLFGILFFLIGEKIKQNFFRVVLLHIEVFVDFNLLFKLELFLMR